MNTMNQINSTNGMANSNAMTPEKVSFVFKTTWYNVLKNYDLEVRNIIFGAIIEYGATGEVPEIKDPGARMFFDLIRIDMDENTRRYEEVCEKRRQVAQNRWARTKKGKEALAAQASANKLAANQPSASQASDTQRAISQTTNTQGTASTQSTITQPAAPVQSTQKAEPAHASMPQHNSMQQPLTAETKTKQTTTAIVPTLSQIKTPSITPSQVSAGASSPTLSTPKATSPLPTAQVAPGMMWSAEDAITVWEQMKTEVDTINQFCYNEDLSRDEFNKFGDQAVTNWVATKQQHKDEKDIREHILSTILIKKRKSIEYKNQLKVNSASSPRLNPRRGVEPIAKCWQDYVRAF